MSNVHKPSATEESIASADDFDIIDEPRLSTSLTLSISPALVLHENKPCKGDRKPLMIRFLKMLKRRTLASYVFIICAVILLYQAPVVFYYAAISPDIDSSDITDYLDFKRCSVKVRIYT